jgi:hypothetical protein
MGVVRRGEWSPSPSWSPPRAAVPSGGLKGAVEHHFYPVDTERKVDAATALDVLDWSHGCEHIHPRDLDELVSRGVLAPGTPFVVHGYDEVRA